MSDAPLPPLFHTVSVMLFVDGENLAIRYKNMLNGKPSEDHIVHVPDVLVWSSELNLTRHGGVTLSGGIIIPPRKGTTVTLMPIHRSERSRYRSPVRLQEGKK